jgi:hypothetical protein
MFSLLGLTDENPDEFAAQVVTETMNALKDDVVLKSQSWRPRYNEPESEEAIMMNHLLIGDKGFTIADLFNMLTRQI